MSNCSRLYQINLVKVKLVLPKLVKVPNVGENILFFAGEQVKVNFSKRKLPKKLIYAIQTLERDMKYGQS